MDEDYEFDRWHEEGDEILEAEAKWDEYIKQLREKEERENG